MVPDTYNLSTTEFAVSLGYAVRLIEKQRWSECITVNTMPLKHPVVFLRISRSHGS